MITQLPRIVPCQRNDKGEIVNLVEFTISVIEFMVAVINLAKEFNDLSSTSVKEKK